MLWTEASDKTEHESTFFTQNLGSDEHIMKPPFLDLRNGHNDNQEYVVVIAQDCMHEMPSL